MVFGSFGNDFEVRLFLVSSQKSLESDFCEPDCVQCITSLPSQVLEDSISEYRAV